MKMWDVPAGGLAEISGYDSSAHEAVRQRLIDLGFVEGTTVECVRHVPFSGPRVYMVSGSIFALEKEVATLVLVKNEKVRT